MRPSGPPSPRFGGSKPEKEMRTHLLIAASAALMATSSSAVKAQAREPAVGSGIESVLGALERKDMNNSARDWDRDRGESARREAWERESQNRGRYESKRDRDRNEARWRKQKEREMKSCERDLWSRVRRERDRWDDDRRVRSTKDRIHRICERRVYGSGGGWDGWIFDRIGR